MSKLRELTLISLLLVVAVGCSSSDQAAIDKAVSATLAAAQPVIAAPTDTVQPATATPTATVQPATATPTATAQPATATPTATAQPATATPTDDDYIRTTNTLMKFDSEWKALTTFSGGLEGGTPWAYFSGLILQPLNLDYVKKKLNVIKFDLAMTNVPEDLEPIKNGLSEIYEIEINAFDTNEWNPNVTPSNVVEVISVIKAYPGPIGGLYDKRWTEAQLMRKKLYEYWITEMIDKGLGREFVEEFSKDLDELGAITNFGKG